MEFQQVNIIAADEQSAELSLTGTGSNSIINIEFFYRTSLKCLKYFKR